MDKEFKERLLEYAEREEVFTTEEIVKEFAVPQTERRSLNAVLRRLCSSGKLYRYKRGMYGYETYSTLFKMSSHCSEDEAFVRLYLKDDGSYISGADFYYMISLSTWIARKKVIVTNKVKRAREGNTAVFLPPKAFITKENRDYFQLLDCFESFGNLAVDHPDPYGRIMWYIRERGLDIQVLIAFARRYYTKKTLENLTKCLEADYFRNADAGQQVAGTQQTAPKARKKAN